MGINSKTYPTMVHNKIADLKGGRHETQRTFYVFLLVLETLGREANNYIFSGIRPDNFSGHINVVHHRRKKTVHAFNQQISKSSARPIG